MPIVAVLNYKGGAGKTTVSVHFAAAAQLSGLTVTGLDADPQQSAVAWSNARQEPPKFHPVTVDSVEGEAERANGKDRIVVIDTGPRLDTLAAKIARIADLIIIPVKPSIFDELAVRQTVEMLTKLKLQKRARFLLNEVDPRVAEVAETREGLADTGIAAMPFTLGDRVHFKRAVKAGQAVCEAFPNAPANMEMQTLFAYCRGVLGL